MAHIKVLDLDNACSLSELNCEDINIVKGGQAATLIRTRNPLDAAHTYLVVLRRTENRRRARAASLST